MDCLRGLSILLVIVAHAYSIALSDSSGGSLPLVGNFNGAVGPLRMPAMMFLSGLLMPRSLLKGTAAYLNGKVRRILYPYFLWSVLMIVFMKIASMTIGWGFSPDLWFRPFYAPLEHLWFLAYLFLYFVIARLTSSFNPFVMSGVFLLVSFAPITGQWHTFWYYVGFFMLGTGAAKAPVLWAILSSRPWLSALFLTISLLTFVTLDVGQMGLVGEAIRIPFAIVGLVGAAGLAIRVSSAPIFRPLRYVGRNSIIFYLAHWPLIIFSSRFLAQEHQFGVRKLFVASIVVALFGSVALTFLANRFAAVNLLFSMPATLTRVPGSQRASQVARSKLIEVSAPAVNAPAPIPPDLEPSDLAHRRAPARPLRSECR